MTEDVSKEDVLRFMKASDLVRAAGDQLRAVRNPVSSEVAGPRLVGIMVAASKLAEDLGSLLARGGNTIYHAEKEARADVRNSLEKISEFAPRYLEIVLRLTDNLDESAIAEADEIATELICHISIIAVRIKSVDLYARFASFASTHHEHDSVVISEARKFVSAFETLDRQQALCSRLVPAIGIHAGWLVSLGYADDTNENSQPRSAAERMRELRRRRGRGIVAQVTIDIYRDDIASLRDMGLLIAADADNKRAISEACEAALLRLRLENQQLLPSRWEAAFAGQRNRLLKLMRPRGEKPKKGRT